MFGLAQRMFIEKTGKSTPWTSYGTLAPAWPLLEKFLSAQCLGYVDFSLAKHILAKDLGNEQGAALICHLSLAARQGHLCVTIEDDRIIPSPEEIWVSPPDGEKNTECANVNSDDMLVLKKMILAGRFVLNDFIIEVNETTDSSSSIICRNVSNYYLQRHWLLESACIKSLRSIFKELTPALLPDMTTVDTIVQHLLDQKKLLPEQAQGIMQGCLHPFSIITGGPGTGKTYTAGILLKALWNGLSEAQRATTRIALTAPTGKATANLEASIKKAFSQMDESPEIIAKTLHALLEIGKSQHRASKVLDVDILLVDECSMIDVNIMGKLLAALKPGSRLIMLGDRYQLPSVEGGSLFADIVTYLETDSRFSSLVTTLNRCLRAELRAIVDLALSINCGDQKGVLEFLEDNEDGVKRISIDDQISRRDLQRKILNYGSSYFPKVHDLSDNPLELLEAYSRFRILTPLKKGPLGTDALNNLFYQAALSKAKNDGFFAVPIMIVKNDHRLDFFNGEVGLIINDYALFASRTGGIRKISALLLPKYEYAYCLSIHKSQGSEFDHVVLLLPERSQIFGREALYTGVTRARKKLEIWSSRDTLSNMVLNSIQRHSGVVSRLS